MKYPNLRYGNPEEFRHYAHGIPLKILAKKLRRSERCIKNWMQEKKKIPYWVPELLRLRAMEHQEMLRQMNLPGIKTRLGLVTKNAIIYDLPTPATNPTEPDHPQDDSAPAAQLRHG